MALAMTAKMRRGPAGPISPQMAVYAASTEDTGLLFQLSYNVTIANGWYWRYQTLYWRSAIFLGQETFYFLMSTGRSRSRVPHRLEDLTMEQIMALPYNSGVNTWAGCFPRPQSQATGSLRREANGRPLWWYLSNSLLQSPFEGKPQSTERDGEIEL